MLMVRTRRGLLQKELHNVQLPERVGRAHLSAVCENLQFERGAELARDDRECYEQLRMRVCKRVSPPPPSPQTAHFRVRHLFITAEWNACGVSWLRHGT